MVKFSKIVFLYLIFHVKCAFSAFPPGNLINLSTDSSKLCALIVVEDKIELLCGPFPVIGESKSKVEATFESSYTKYELYSTPCSFYYSTSSTSKVKETSSGLIMYSLVKEDGSLWYFVRVEILPVNSGYNYYLVPAESIKGEIKSNPIYSSPEKRYALPPDSEEKVVSPEELSGRDLASLITAVSRPGSLSPYHNSYCKK